MTRANYSSQRLKIEKEIVKLQRQMQNLQDKQRAPAIASIVKSMREYDISLEEITAAFNRRPGGRSAAGSARKASAPKAGKTAKRVIPPKYMHPETKATWTGRGKAPRWITDAEAQGQSRDTFLIQ